MNSIKSTPFLVFVSFCFYKSKKSVDFLFLYLRHTFGNSIDKRLYHDWDNIGYLAELLSVIDSLLTGRDILLISQKGPCHVIGKKQAEYIKLNVILVDGKDYIVTEGIDGPNYFNSNKQQAYWPNTFPDNHFKFPVSKLAYSYSISQELKELVKHNFKSEEEIRFSKQQFVSWVAIGVSLLLGILGVIF